MNPVSNVLSNPFIFARTIWSTPFCSSWIIKAFFEKLFDLWFLFCCSRQTFVEKKRGSLSLTYFKTRPNILATIAPHKIGHTKFWEIIIFNIVTLQTSPLYLTHGCFVIGYTTIHCTSFETDKESGWEFTKLLRQICKIFCNFKVLLQSSYS